MAETTTTPTPVVTPDPTPDQRFEQDLEALMKKPAEAAVSETVPPGAEPPPAEPVADSLETKLAAIPDVVPKTPDAPQLSPEQQQILSVIPDVRTAQQITTLATGYQNFSSAFEGGDFDRVEQMFEAWNPDAYQAFKEHVYQKHVASGEWVDRWIQDKEGNPAVNSGMKRLEQQINNLQAQLSQRNQSEAQQQNQMRLNQITNAYQAHLTRLFDHIDFSPADRRWVTADINYRVAGNNAVRAAIGNGDIAAVNPMFKAAVKEYVDRDKVVSDKRETTIAMQDRKKPLVPGAPMVPTQGITDEQIAASKGDAREKLLDAKMDQELNELFSRKRK